MDLTNKHNLVTGILWENLSIELSKSYRKSKGKSDVSATQLIDSPLISELKRKYSDEIELDVTDTIGMSLGTIMHKAMEEVSPDDWFVEHRFFKEVNGWLLSGQADFIIPTEGDEEGLITNVIIGDHKNTSIYKLKKDKHDLVEFESQLNVLAYLVKNADWVEDSNGNIVNWSYPSVDSLVIAGNAKDFSKPKAIQNDFPSPLKEIWFDVWDDDKLEEYILERVSLHQHARSVDISEIPQCTNKEMWAGEDMYAVMKEGSKNAKKKVNTVEEAEAYIKELKDKAKKELEESTSGIGTKVHDKLVANTKVKYYVETRPSARTRCLFYCDYAKFCPYGENVKAEKKVNDSFKKLMDKKLKKVSQ